MLAALASSWWRVRPRGQPPATATTHARGEPHGARMDRPVRRHLDGRAARLRPGLVPGQLGRRGWRAACPVPGTGVDLDHPRRRSPTSSSSSSGAQPGRQQRRHLPGGRVRRAVVDERARIPGARRCRASRRPRSADLGGGALRRSSPRTPTSDWSRSGRSTRAGSSSTTAMSSTGSTAASSSSTSGASADVRSLDRRQQVPRHARRSCRPMSAAWSSSITARRSGSGASGSADCDLSRCGDGSRDEPSPASSRWSGGRDPRPARIRSS